MIYTFEDFIEEAWDYVSPNVVSDDYWEANNELIREVTFEFYEMYRKSLIVLPTGEEIERFTPKASGRLLESTFSILQKNKESLMNYWCREDQ